MDDGTYGLDATFQGSSGYEHLKQHTALLDEAGVRYSLRQELGDGWTLRFGPLGREQVLEALNAFVR